MFKFRDAALILFVLILAVLLFNCGKKTTKPEIKQVSKPTISPGSGDYNRAVEVTIRCSTEGARIYYTSDGSEPDEDSLLYSETFWVNSSSTIKARAYKEGWSESDVADESYVMNLPTVATPILSPSEGTYNGIDNITIRCTTVGAAIRYTTDGSTPDETSTLYAGAITIEGSTTIKAKAYRSGWIESSIAEAHYEFKVANPVFSMAGGEFYSNQSVAISCATANATIRYTTDGSTPTSSSKIYTGAISIDECITLKARAFKENWSDSDTVEAEYNLKVVNPVLSSPGGSYSAPQSVSITCVTAGAEIRYTIDGGFPNSSSTLYTEPIQINGNATLRVKAFKPGWQDSSLITAIYVLNLTYVIAPEFIPPAGVYGGPQMVRISCATTGATIRYTTDGSEPNLSSPAYSGRVLINDSATLKAKAYKAGLTDSETVSADYVIGVATPTFSPAGGTYYDTQSVSISCATPGATIRYTTDNSEPTLSSPIYTDAITVIQTTTIKARAYKNGLIDSDIAGATYRIEHIGGDMAYVPGGTFTMGRTRGHGDYDELPSHSVSIVHFVISKYPVTQDEFEHIMGYNPGHDFPNFDSPVCGVAWYEALKYCNLRSINDGFTPVYSINGSTNPYLWGEVPDTFDDAWDNVSCSWHNSVYRLLTEAEWEYASRGATNNPDYLYSGSDNIDEVAWYADNSNETPKPVGLKAPNRLYIYDMSGNAAEWCWDWYDPDYYHYSPQNNPKGPADGEKRVARGGSYASLSDQCRVSHRGRGLPFDKNTCFGFRVCRGFSVEPPTP